MGLFKHKEEFDYFKRFEECAAAASEEAKYLCGCLEKFDKAKVPVHVKAMQKIENRADGLKHELTNRLAHEFMTPIELEDISALAQAIDDIVDAVEEVIRRIYMYDVSALRPEAKELSKLVVEACELFESVAKEFRNFKKSETIEKSIIGVNTIESRGDEIYAAAVRRLFTEKNSVEEKIVWLSIFESLEISLDTCEKAANIVENTIMKNT